MSPIPVKKRKFEMGGKKGTLTVRSWRSPGSGGKNRTHCVNCLGVFQQKGLSRVEGREKGGRAHKGFVLVLREKRFRRLGRKERPTRNIGLSLGKTGGEAGGRKKRRFAFLPPRKNP